MRLGRHVPWGVLKVLATALLISSCRSSGDPSGEGDAPSPVVDVHVAAIVRTSLRGYVSAWGTIEPEPNASARVAALVPGLVDRVACTEGDVVARDAILFQLDSRLIDIALDKARQTVDYATRVFERQKMLGPGEATSMQQYQDAEQNLVVAQNELRNVEAQRALLTIRSPLAGTVVRIDARPGDTVDLNRVLAQVIDLDRLVVAATVRSADVARLEVGQAVEIRTDDVAGSARSTGVPTHTSELLFIGSEVDSETGTVRIRTKVPREAGLLPGQFVNIRIAAEEHRDRLAVPVESVVTAGGRSEIAVVEGKRARRVEVTIGIEDGAVVEIEGQGLAEGMTVVTDGVYGLGDESEIRVIDP